MLTLVSWSWHVCEYWQSLRTHLVAYSCQIALGFMVKFNDGTVARLRRKNGDIFERMYLASSVDNYPVPSILTRYS
jgi:hypothetical protein